MTDKKEAANGVGSTSAAGRDDGICLSAFMLAQVPQEVNFSTPPSDDLRRSNYDLWEYSRRRYLLAQAQAMGAL